MTQKKNNTLNGMEKYKKFFEEFLYDFESLEGVDVAEFKMGSIPFTIERVSDGRILQLNDDNKTYSFTDTITLSPNKYSWGRLFMDHRCVGAFKPIGWVKIENLETMHKFVNEKDDK